MTKTSEGKKAWIERLKGLTDGYSCAFLFELVCFGSSDMELGWQSACLVLSGLSSILVGHWCLERCSCLLTTDMN